MSDDINPTRSPTLTEQIQGGDAQFRLKMFNTMIQQAQAYQIVLKQEGSINDEECTSIIQGYGHMKNEITQADNSFCCGQCGEGSLHLFSDDDGLCVWCIQANEAEDEKKANGEETGGILSPSWKLIECEHIDYAETLTGAVCNDCGEEHTRPDILQAIEEENLCICADCGEPAPQWIEDPHHNDLADCPHPLGIWADCSEGKCGTMTGVEFDSHDLPQHLGGQGTNCDHQMYLRHFPDSYTCTLEEYVSCLREERDEA